MSLSAWFRVIRVKFLLASVIAVLLGLAVSYWKAQNIDLTSAVITMGGVVALHASVDLLNDYWDYKRGIDTATKRTKFSGGTGVLPEGLLKPSTVYRAGILFLVLGSLAGVYFVALYGWIIAAILGFAIISIYFYSTRIVDSGLGEIFVAIKGCMIVLGTSYIQTQSITATDIAAGIVAGTLSSFVLYITSFPDHDADKQKGRRTLVIVLGKASASKVFWAFPAVAYGFVIGGIVSGLFPVFCLLSLASSFFALDAGRKITASINDEKEFLSVMKSTLLFSRVTGALFVAGFLVSFVADNYG
ncbi:MAG: prenyltransferase [Candidatus Nitrosotenuis sp.]|uniref:UbiA prenyltransferase n=1 Tax=Candidatus Nitrosotenuis uzonensis TaxID=1407055 RepID=A0A812F575_9ARCH|nr:prenyltransferase [Candidatus Nitrosotenuis uzonensis]CAE6498619.1 UbiA prenyltransferase [Candidatus Nitrosotenuis uzonensis]